MFEIVYSDGSVVRGSTAADFGAAPDDGIQFVIVSDDSGIEVHKGEDEYRYGGITKPGSWTDRATYDGLKGRLRELSCLL